jgi:ABC-2 type transport system permease protein
VRGELVSFAGFLLGQPVLAGMNVPHASLAQHESLRAVLGAGVYIALVGLLGVALGVLIRSTAGAIVVLVVAAIIVPYLLGPLLPPLVRGLWPIMAGMMVMSTTTKTGIPAVTLLGVMALGVGATVAAACVVFRRRDV